MTEPECECYMTPPETWTTCGGVTEPGSVYEPNPDCPAHPIRYEKDTPDD